jgi:hemoglobin
VPDRQQTMIDRVAALHPQGDAKAAVAMVVEDFYRRILADDDIAPYFADTDIGLQQRRITDALVLALGGTQRRYQDVDHLRDRLRASHKRLGITTDHYAVVGGALSETLVDAGVPQDIRSHLLDLVVDVRGDIVASVPPPPAAQPAPDRPAYRRWLDRLRDRFARL